MVYLVQSKDDFDQQVTDAGDKLILIDFYANWCGPCKIISPKLEELAQQYADRAVVLKVNVDENEEITIRYNVTSLPTFVFIKTGTVVDCFVGCNSEKLAKTMEKYVGSECDCGQGTDDDEPDSQTPLEGANSDNNVCAINSNFIESEQPDAPDDVIDTMEQEGVMEN
ncbi:thioredoxin-2 [Drosophila pseudoobscura]|uniref:Thioredoxin-2 n=1 Tax=Drosophila pseudoobscura pseudoobscura TaxID=46245 RepID=A0A6I8UH39_DROPS|nr:thioredoxin-2 [Drosophila pseudoobscura]